MAIVASASRRTSAMSLCNRLWPYRTDRIPCWPSVASRRRSRSRSSAPSWLAAPSSSKLWLNPRHRHRGRTPAAEPHPDLPPQPFETRASEYVLIAPQLEVAVTAGGEERQQFPQITAMPQGRRRREHRVDASRSRPSLRDGANEGAPPVVRPEQRSRVDEGVFERSHRQVVAHDGPRWLDRKPSSAVGNDASHPNAPLPARHDVDGSRFHGGLLPDRERRGVAERRSASRTPERRAGGGIRLRRVDQHSPKGTSEVACPQRPAHDALRSDPARLGPGDDAVVEGEEAPEVRVHRAQPGSGGVPLATPSSADVDKDPSCGYRSPPSAMC